MKRCGGGGGVKSTASASASAISKLTKTPKSALLEKRRRAVSELLKDEIYPSGKLKIRFFLNYTGSFYIKKKKLTEVYFIEK